MSEGKHYSGGGEKTVAKNVILEKYLWSYLSIMSKPDNWSGPKWYVDSHSGTGYTKELGVEVPGSAIRALNFDFDEFHFFEKSGDHFRTLVDTLNKEKDANLTFGQHRDLDVPMASSEETGIYVLNMDCNPGVQYLTKVADDNSHWFTFVDPERFTATRELMDSLRHRGQMDILFNFQTTGFHRNTGEGADHSHEKAKSNLGKDFPINGTPEELVRHYKKDVFKDRGWKANSRKMVSEGSNEWRYDLIFASKKALAVNIMTQIFDGDLKNDVSDEIQKWRARSEAEQTGFESFLSLGTHDKEDEDQSSLVDFE